MAPMRDEEKRTLYTGLSNGRAGALEYTITPMRDDGSGRTVRSLVLWLVIGALVFLGLVIWMLNAGGSIWAMALVASGRGKRAERKVAG